VLFFQGDSPAAAERFAAADPYVQNGLIALKCGVRSIRFRPMLDLDAGGVEEGLEILARSLFDARKDGAQL